MGGTLTTYVVVLPPSAHRSAPAAGTPPPPQRLQPVAQARPGADDVDVYPHVATVLPDATDLAGESVNAAGLRVRYDHRVHDVTALCVLGTIQTDAFGTRALCLEVAQPVLASLPVEWRSGAAVRRPTDRWIRAVHALLVAVEADALRLRERLVPGCFVPRPDLCAADVGDYVDEDRRVHPGVARQRWALAPAGATVTTVDWDPVLRVPRQRTRTCHYLRQSAAHLRMLTDWARGHVNLATFVGMRAVGPHVSVYSAWAPWGTLADLVAADRAPPHIRCGVLIGACAGLHHLNLRLRFVHHRVRPTAVSVGVGGIGVLSELADASPLDDASVPPPRAPDREDGLSPIPHHSVACDQVAFLLTAVSVLSGVDWTAFTAANPPSLRVYRDLVRRARPPVHTDLLSELSLLCDADPAPPQDRPWGSYEEHYERITSALRGAPSVASQPPGSCHRPVARTRRASL